MHEIFFTDAAKTDADYFYETRKEGMEPHMAKIGRIWDETVERAYNQERFETQLPFLRIIHLRDQNKTSSKNQRIGFVSVRPSVEGFIYLESFCLERRYQSQGLATEVFELIVTEPQYQGKTFRSEIMKGYPSGKLAEKVGFQLIDETGDLDIFERKPVDGASGKSKVGTKP